MLRFVIGRIGLAVVTLFVVSLIVFVVAQVIPGDVGRTILGQLASDEQVRQLDHQLGVDQPIDVQYFHWITRFVHGDWGTSFLYQTPVRGLVLSRLGNSLILAAFALAIVVPLGIAAGVVAALRYPSTIDSVITIAAAAFTAIPEFVTGIVLLIIFAVQVRIFPVSSVPPQLWNPASWIHQLLLPSLPLVLVLFGYIARMARAGTIESLNANYTRTAVLKGLPMTSVVWRHVLPNSLLPTITVVGVQAGALIGGLVVIESLFSYPGIGQLTLNSATGHDIPTLEATVLVIAVVYMVLNLIADFLYGVLDPRLRVRWA